eukprot:m51a1_g3354 hypothetical protein (140) ;mRNA; f:415714-416248
MEDAQAESFARRISGLQDPSEWHAALPISREFRSLVLRHVAGLDSEQVSKAIEGTMKSGNLEDVVDLVGCAIDRPEFFGESQMREALILAAARVRPERVMKFVRHLRESDPDIAVALRSEGLHAEADEVIRNLANASHE